MEVIWFGSNANFKKLQKIYLNLNARPNTIAFVDAVRDNELILTKHIAKVTSVGYIRLPCAYNKSEIEARLVSAYVVSGLDYYILCILFIDSIIN